VTLAGYCFNVAATLIFFGWFKTEGLFSLITSLIYLAIWPICAFFLWNWSLYRALQTDSKIWCGVFFVGMALQVAIFALVGIGLLGGAAGGIVALIEYLVTARLIPAVLTGTATAITGFNLVAGVYLLQAAARRVLAEPAPQVSIELQNL
jgi:hypothetical protein